MLLASTSSDESSVQIPFYVILIIAGLMILLDVAMTIITVASILAVLRRRDAGNSTTLPDQVAQFSSTVCHSVSQSGP